MYKEHLTSRITELLDYLSAIQQVDGSFKTFYKHNLLTQNEWVNNGKKNAPIDTASIVLPLFTFELKVSKKILKRAVYFLDKSAPILPLWRYYPASGKSHVIPFDIDSTALSSFVLEKAGIRKNNKNLLNSYRMENGYFSTYLFPKKIKDISIPQFLYFKLESWRNSNSKTIGIYSDDFETASTCNTLLYLGIKDKNSVVFNRVKADIFSDEIKGDYFSEFYNFYAFARCCFYNNVLSLFSEEYTSISLVKKYYSKLNRNTSILDMLYFVNGCFFLNLQDIDHVQEKVDELFGKLEMFSEIAIFSSSHSRLTFENLSYFSSQGIVASTMLELLNLYHLRFFGCYYSEKQILKT